MNRDNNKWSDPFVGMLVYQELIYLKNNFQIATIILDCAQRSVEGVFDEVIDDFINRGQMTNVHKELLTHILLSKYRSQRAIAGALVGRKSRHTDVLPSNQGNSRLISVNSIEKHLDTLALERIVREVDNDKNVSRIVSSSLLFLSFILTLLSDVLILISA